MKVFNKTSRGIRGIREIALDIETTGLFTDDGNRIVEVGAVEMYGRKTTGREFHSVIDPERDIPERVVAIHGISNEKAAGKPKFAEIAQQLRDFIGNDPIIITCRTKAGYTLDIAFMDMEMEKAGLPKFSEKQWLNVRRWSEIMFGEKSATLDSVLDRYRISRKEREDHGHSAILDARLLSEAYPKLFREYANFTQKKSVAATAKADKQPNP